MSRECDRGEVVRSEGGRVVGTDGLEWVGGGAHGVRVKRADSDLWGTMYGDRLCGDGCARASARGLAEGGVWSVSR